MKPKKKRKGEARRQAGNRRKGNILLFSKVLHKYIFRIRGAVVAKEEEPKGFGMRKRERDRTEEIGNRHTQ